MKILVAMKRTPHRDAKMQVGPDGTLSTRGDLKYEVNPFDELAIEEALRIQETQGGETVVVTVSGDESNQQILTALAMGIDRAIRVDTDRELDSLQIARCLSSVVKKEEPDLVLSGKLAVDDENGQIPSMLAALLGWPQANQASAIEFVSENTIRVECEVDQGINELEIDLPAVVTADLRLNEPRYASLPGIMKAKKKPLEVVELSSLEDVGELRARVTGYRALPPKEKGVLVDSPQALVEALVERKLI